MEMIDDYDMDATVTALEKVGAGQPLTQEEYDDATSAMCHVAQMMEHDAIVKFLRKKKMHEVADEIEAHLHHPEDRRPT